MMSNLIRSKMMSNLKRNPQVCLLQAVRESGVGELGVEGYTLSTFHEVWYQRSYVIFLEV